jgi:hypothetical protein
MAATRPDHVSDLPTALPTPASGPDVLSHPQAKPLPRHRVSLRLVLVRWHDAWFDFEKPGTDWRDDYLVQTVGFLVREEPGVISVAQELLPHRDGFRAITHIPTGVVESVTTLYEATGPGRRAGDQVLREGT